MKKRGPTCEKYILLAHEKEGSSHIYSTSTDGYQLRIEHLVDKDKYIYNMGNICKGTTMQPITVTQEPYT
jgi:hypothetical protein